jgi:uncharacterized protein YecT (DUF1311 family)
MVANVRLRISAIVMLASGLCSVSVGSAQDQECETTAGARRCLARRIDSMEVELRRVVGESRRTAQGKTLFDAAQAAWRRYVEADCRAAADVYRGGSLAPVVAQSCRLDHLRLRMQYLRNDYLDDADERAPGRRAMPEALPLDSVRPG